MNGIVKRIIGNRNFGFIRADTTGTEYFFRRDDFVGHWDDLVYDAENTSKVVPVEFETSPDSPKGPRAANVRRTDFPNQAV